MDETRGEDTPTLDSELDERPTRSQVRDHSLQTGALAQAEVEYATNDPDGQLAPIEATNTETGEVKPFNELTADEKIDALVAYCGELTSRLSVVEGALARVLISAGEIDPNIVPVSVTRQEPSAIEVPRNIAGGRLMSVPSQNPRAYPRGVGE